MLDDFAAAHPDAPRVGVGDLSRPGGGDFGRRFGGLGHVSHQNGLDVDVYYPRRDRLERAPRRVAHVDRVLAQELVDRFVRAGALRVFVGPNVGLRGPRPTVQKLPRHDDHLHLRLPLEPTRRWENPVTGHELQLPTELAARADEGGTTHVTTAGVRIRLSDLGIRPGEPAQREGSPLSLRTVTSFRVERHHFQASVELGRSASERKREQAVALLESVRLTAFGRTAANIHSVRVLGRSIGGRPIRAWRIGNPKAEQRLLVVGCIHGDECEGMRVTQQLVNLVRPVALDLWVIQNLNPDGLAERSRGNARGVDLNRDFLAATQRETQIARKLILQLRPDVTIWFHQPQSVVRAWGPSRAIARRYARARRRAVPLARVAAGERLALAERDRAALVRRRAAARRAPLAGGAPSREGRPRALAVDSSRVLARHRRGDGARGAARGRAGAVLLLPLRLVADLNAGAAPPA